MITLKDKPVLLIADDQPDNLQAIMTILQRSEMHYTFITVPNGRVLLEVAAKKLPDLIITDWEMPGMTGLEAVRELKKDHQLRDIPVIMATGIWITTQNLEEALEAGASDFIRKPLEPVELIARVKSMLKLSASFKRIKDQNKELEIMNVLKDRLLSIVSHDARGPLTSLKGMLALLSRNAVSPEDIQELTAMLGIQLSQVMDFLETLLHWVNHQLITASPEVVCFQLNHVLQETVDLLTPAAQGKKISILSHLNESVIASADKEMARIVIRNLISNAIKFCREKGNIAISMHREENVVKVCVDDTGVGISQENLSKLFGLQHLSTKGTNKEVGTGLGLMLCRQYVTLNGGNMGVESEEGKGSTFWFTLPLANPVKAEKTTD